MLYSGLMRIAAAVLILACAHAPLQCGRHGEDPELRRYETPPEALYDLAERFHARGDEEARRATLQFLVERYPNSRFARMAQEQLEGSR